MGADHKKSLTIVEINSMTVGSTGRIMRNVADYACKNGHTVYMAYPDNRMNRKFPIENNAFVIGNIWERNLHLQLDKYTGYNGCFSKNGTKKFLKWVSEKKPDIMHFHNLHNCYINLPMLFSYVKKNRIRVIWTLHDCWAFTGKCPYFDVVNCDSWKTGCQDCKQVREYPYSIRDNTKNMYVQKRRWFTGMENAVLVTPSEWLKNLVKQSFLREYPVEVINNGIDLQVFCPTESSFRKKYQLEEKFIVLGVAFAWEYRKGLDIFTALAKILPQNYKIVLVGVPKDLANTLPDQILTIPSTNNQTELAKIYSAADVFLNPTREDNFPTTHLEALACGTPVITFRTGGSMEMLDDSCGISVEKEDIHGIVDALKHCRETPFSKLCCVKKAERYNMCDKYKEYVQLYEKVGD